ncbi:pyrimidine utilization protein D [Bradyrhizobium sp. BR 10289]|uniref:pyrimidine utilization protein D n=1 Tax=Bradyrhizobium sp. BR 10289 TaxID=2749993 RepID=UPI001C6464C4|nr:pyrimidine utilization protein D [Bradyrhizobium sp. BR 10289]MBW7974852.1 pyrimidine utilization protein D [Bradyrhizobium sp. BR 10289]
MAFARGKDAGIYYEVHGRGTPIVLSAGMGGSGSFWAPQLKALADRHQVILYDHVGTGHSEAGSRSIAGMADDIACVLDHAAVDAAHVVGHAIGGIVGIELSLRHPKRLRSLTVVNGWGRADPFLRRCFEIRKQLLNQSGPQAYVRAQPLFLYPPQWISDNIAHLDAEEEKILKHFPSVATMNQRIDMFLAFEGGRRLREINVPTLLSSAKDDALVPAYLTRELAATIPNSRVHEVDWGAHAFSVVTPKIFNDTLLDFLKEVDR